MKLFRAHFALWSSAAVLPVFAAQSQSQFWQLTLFAALCIVLPALFVLLHRFLSRKLIEKNRELEQRLNANTNTINELMTQKERLFATISHELKSPLTLILNPLEAVNETQPKDVILEKVELIKRNGNHLLRIVEQLLEMSQLQITGAKQWHHYSLHDTLNLLLVSFQPIIDSKNIHVHVQAFDDVILRLKSNSLELILTNLLSNAIKFTEPKGSITFSVQTDRAQKHTTIAIKDTGIGISPALQSQVFEQFVKDDQQQHNIPGVGIGLTLVKELIEANHGTITLESKQGLGSTFTLKLPLADTDESQIQALEALSDTSKLEIMSLSDLDKSPGASKPVSTDDEDKPLVLLIDDNKDMLKLLQGILIPYYRCMLSNNGTSGLTKAQEYLPDLVICDVLMPGIDGFEVLCALKADPLTCHIPVVLLTAKADVQSRIKGWESNADEYIEKPFHVDELLSRVENLLAIRQLLHGRYQQEFSRINDAEDVTLTQGEEEQIVVDKDSQQMLNSVNAKFINQLNKVMEKHYTDETFDVGLLADELTMSNRQLHRKTKSILDLTPKESIRHFRLKKAAELLKKGVAAGEVAVAVGFASHSYFSQCFKAQFNCSPSAFVE